MKNYKLLKMMMGLVLVALMIISACAKTTEADFTVTLTRDGEGAVITGYTGKVGAVRIPATIQGMPVVGIGEEAFKENKVITSVVIPEGIGMIGDGVFRGCPNLTTVTLSEGLEIIGRRAFRECSKLTTIILPQGLEVIGASAFYDCLNLKTITLPEGLLAIGDEAFANVPLSEIKLPESLTYLGEASFANTKITSFAFTSNLEEVGDGVFAGCINLKKVTAPENLFTVIPAAMFQRCTALTDITIPEGLTYIGKNAFEDSGLVSITLPASIKEIGQSAFNNCKNLDTVNIPDSVTTIRFNSNNQFTNCSKLNLQSQAVLRKLGYRGTF